MEKVTRFFSIFHIKFSKIDAKSYINRIYNIKHKKDIFSEQFFFFLGGFKGNSNEFCDL